MQNTLLFINSCFSIQPIDGTLTGTTTPGQSGPGSNGDEGVLHIPQTSKTGTSPSGHVDPQPPPSSTHMIKRVGDCHKGNRVGAIIWVLGLDVTSRLIGGGGSPTARLA